MRQILFTTSKALFLSGKTMLVSSKNVFVSGKKYVANAVGNKEGYRQKLKDDLLKIKAGLAQEGQESKEMLQIYGKFTYGKASKEQMAFANKQFIDLLKGMGLGVIVVLPFSPITIPIIVALGKKYGIDVLPSSFTTASTTKAEKEKN